MEQIPSYLQVLHNEAVPVGSLGRGTHYSVFRATVSHDATGKPLSEAQHHDFAVIWDEDHNVRIFEAIDGLYQNDMLSAFTVFGERKGMLTAILSADMSDAARISTLAAKLQSLCADLDDDSWTSRVASADEPDIGIINDTDAKVQLYLANIKMLWQLGRKEIKSH